MLAKELNGPLNIKVRLVIPAEEKRKCKHPGLHGEHFGYDGAEGIILALAGKTGAWVCFGDTIYTYVGCPVAWLHRVYNVT